MVRGNGTPLKDRILHEARRVLEDEGVAALSTRRLAKAVGCTATALYLYFDNKEALLHALMEEGFEMLGTRLEASSRTQETHQRARSLARAYVDFGLEHPAWYELMFLLPPERLGAPYPADKYRASRRHLERLSQALSGTAPGRSPSYGHDPSPAGALAAATLLWSSLHGLVALLLAGRVDASLDREQLIEAAIQRGLLPFQPGSPGTTVPDALPATGSPDLTP